jgi:signal transduction histidine kinase
MQRTDGRGGVGNFRSTRQVVSTLRDARFAGCEPATDAPILRARWSYPILDRRADSLLMALGTKEADVKRADPFHPVLARLALAAGFTIVCAVLSPVGHSTAAVATATGGADEAIAAPSEAAQFLQEQNQELVIGAVAILLVQAALIAGLLVQRSRRRDAEERLRCREAELRSSYERIRDIAGRLVTAQETERSRIAQELHDDIAQQLVLLRLDLHQSGSNEGTLERVDAIGKSVHELSHRLHPASLQLFGLVSSLRGLQREQSRFGIAITFTHGDIPAGISLPLTLCLFRVAQEALHNAMKHSRAKHVSVDLRRENAELTLTIADDGVGCDLESAWRKGLGLIGIRDRVEANGGTVAIRSNQGRGTRFDVRVPMDEEPADLTPAGHPVATRPEPERQHGSPQLHDLVGRGFSSSSFASGTIVPSNILPLPDRT